MNETDRKEEIAMETRSTVILEVNDNSLKSRLLAAFNNRPDWALSFTTAMVGDRVRVTYSSDAAFGVDMQAAWDYVERH